MSETIVGLSFAVDSVLKFWVDLPGWPKSNTFKRVLLFLFVSACHYHYDMNFDEGYGGTISQPVWMSLVHCVRSFYGVFGAIDFDEFSTLVVNAGLLVPFFVQRISCQAEE